MAGPEDSDAGSQAGPQSQLRPWLVTPALCQDPNVSPRFGFRDKPVWDVQPVILALCQDPSACPAFGFRDKPGMTFGLSPRPYARIQTLAPGLDSGTSPCGTFSPSSWPYARIQAPAPHLGLRDRPVWDALAHWRSVFLPGPELQRLADVAAPHRRCLQTQACICVMILGFH
jgi:hypothetical protein